MPLSDLDRIQTEQSILGDQIQADQLATVIASMEEGAAKDLVSAQHAALLLGITKLQAILNPQPDPPAPCVTCNPLTHCATCHNPVGPDGRPLNPPNLMPVTVVE